MPKLNIDWPALVAKLPTKKDDAETAKRAEMFKAFDTEGHGLLCLAEVDKGVRDVLQVEDIFDAKPVIMRAFQEAKKCMKEPHKHVDYVNRREFRMLLVYLECYLKIWEVFESVDNAQENRLSKDEFEGILPRLQKWCPDANIEQLWTQLSEGGHHILFTAFAEWAVPLVLKNDDPEQE